VNVTNGKITILFAADAGHAIINAIQIVAQGTVAITPSSANLSPSQTQQFTATVGDATNSGVVWTLAPSIAGSITPSGLYTAPSIITAAQTVTLTATAQASPYSSQTATINLYPAGTLLLSPGSANLIGGHTQQFTATMANAGAATVTWSISPANAGSISTSGFYTAPSLVTTSQTVTVIATAANGSTATATINLQPTVSVSVTPATATLGPSESKQLTASVSGTWNNAVTWSVIPTGMGSITSAGVYTAPSTVTASTSVTIMAASVANPGTVGAATLTLLPTSATVPVAVTPSTVSLTNGQTQKLVPIAPP
jgi:hypothetical protein